ncbi:MAG: DsrE family protein [Rhodomicrobium sp.]
MQELVVMVTHGPESPEMATTPFVMAATAIAMNVEVLVGLQASGVFLGMKGTTEHVAAPGFPPLKDLLKTYVESGGKIYVCGPCAGSRAIPQQDLTEGASIVGAATFVTECLSATNVLVY